MPLQKKVEDVDEAIWDAIWCPACGSRDFVQHTFDGVFCEGCGAGVKIPLGADHGRAVVKFSDPKPWGMVENDAKEIGGAAARLEKRGGSWHFIEWLGERDFAPCAPEPREVEQVETVELTETDKQRLVN